MKQQHSAISNQRSVIKPITCAFIVIAMFMTICDLCKPAFANDAQDKGTLVIPKREHASAPVKETPSGISAAVEDLQKKFSTIKDIKGSFVQKSYIKDLEETQEYSGTFFVRKPSQMMWEYAAPRDEKVVINDQETWIYKKSQNQVIKTRFTKKEYSQVPIALLTGLENIRNDFDITAPDRNALQLVPKQKTGFIKYLVLETGQGDMPIKMFTIFDTYDNIIMIELRDVRTNAGIDSSIFTFKIPPGAEVYDMNQ